MVLTGEEYDPSGDDNVAEEILARHRNSRQPESKQINAVMGAVMEVVKEEGLKPTPTALFAALMSSLENQATRSTPEVATAVGNILGLVLARTPNAIIRSKFQASAALICDCIDEHMDKAPLIRAYLGCLSQLLAAADRSLWGPHTARAWASTLHLSTDPRPKVRKKAASGIVDVLAALQGSPSLSVASEALQRACTGIFQAPEAAARAAAAAPGKKRAEAEAAITEAVSEALYMMGALKMALPLASSEASAAVSQLMVAMYQLRQPLLTRHATSVLTSLAEAPSSHLPSEALAELLKIVLGRSEVWEARDTEVHLSVSSFLAAAICRLKGEADKSLPYLLPKTVHTLVQQLGAEQDGVRFAAVGSLRKVLETCLDAELCREAPAANGKPTCAQSVVAAVTSALSPQYESSWSSALPLVGGMFKVLGSEHAHLASAPVERLGEMLSGASEGVEDGDLEAVECQPAVEATIGAALRHLGPEAVLEVLPLRLQEGLNGQGDSHAWLLPLIRRYVSGANLALWGSQFLPLARAMGTQAAALLKSSVKGSAPKAAICRTLEMQIFHTLPAFATGAQDVAEAFPKIARDIGTAYQNRLDLRSPICLALSRLCTQARKQAADAGILESVGIVGKGPAGSNNGNDDDDDDDDAAAPDPMSFADGISNHKSPAEVRKDVEILQQFAPNFLVVLLDSYNKTEPEERSEIGTTISAYASVSTASVLANGFRTIIQKLIKVTQDAQADVPPPDMITEGGDTALARRCTFMDLALCVAGGLDTAGISTLYKAAMPALKEKDSAIQKRGYKILAYICEEHKDFAKAHAQEIIGFLVEGLSYAHSAVKRHRLRTVRSLILLLDSPDAPDVALPSSSGTADNEPMSVSPRKQVVASLVSEIVMCTKESNKKTRAAAYDLLVEIGKAMDNNRLATVSLDTNMDSEDSGLQSLFTMVMAGLVASHPHMISASVTALARLTFEFTNRLSEDMPKAVIMLFRTKSREVVKACLGFVKVVVMRLSAGQLEEHIKGILEGVLLWASDSKNRFKLKVRTIVEALAKRCGFDAVAAHIPESDAKLLVHIRKQKARKQRQRDEARSAANGEEGDADMDARSRASSAASSRARTARGSEWGHTAIFSDLMDDDDDGEDDAGGRRSGSMRSAKNAGAKQGRLKDSGDEPMDLLGKGASRELMRARGGRKVDRSGDGDFERGDDGRMVIAEEEDGGRGGKRALKRGRPAEDSDGDSGDDDGDSLGALTQAVKSGAGRAVKFANSVGGASGARSISGRSIGNASKASMRSTASRGSNKEHAGDRFKPKRKGTGGDVKGKGTKVEPYAYWPLDKKMLNRRGAKRQAAKHGLDKVLKTASGAPRGMKAKRARAN